MARTKQTTQNTHVESRRSQGGKLPKTKLTGNPGASGASGPGLPGVRKPHRFRPGTVALREIRKYQTNTDNLLPSASLVRLIREVAQDVKITGKPVRFTKKSLEALQIATEEYITKTLSKAYRISISAKRVTLMKRDMLLLRNLLDDDGLYMQMNTEEFGKRTNKVKTAAKKEIKKVADAEPVVPEEETAE